MNSEVLVNLQIGLEYRVDGSGRLVPFPGSSEQAWFVCYAGDFGERRFYRHDLPGELRLELEGLPEGAAFEDPAAAERILGNRLFEDAWVGRSGTVPTGAGAEGAGEVRLLRWGDRSAVEDSGLKLIAANADGLFGDRLAGFRERPAAGAFVDGALVSICESSRENEAAAEAWVQTAANHRGRGCGRAAVAAWAGAIQKNGKVPLYSYSEENEASAALLRSLGGEEFARVVAFA
jgi:hypothetical protein